MSFQDNLHSSTVWPLLCRFLSIPTTCPAWQTNWQIHVYLELPLEQVSILLAAWYQALAVKSESSTSIKGFSDSSSLSFDLLVCGNVFICLGEVIRQPQRQVKALAVANSGLDFSAVHRTIGSMDHLTRERQLGTVKWPDSGSLWFATNWPEVHREVGTCTFIPEPLRGNLPCGTH